MTAVITPFGLWEFLRMPFGLRGAAQTFQRFMDRVTQGLRNIFVYMDDILIASESAADHQDDLRALFQRLDEHGLVVKKAKCVFGAEAIDFLGHRVDGNGITPLEEKVRAIRDFPTPTDVRNETMVIVQHSEETLEGFDVGRRRKVADRADFFLQRRDAVSVDPVAEEVDGFGAENALRFLDDESVFVEALEESSEIVLVIGGRFAGDKDVVHVDEDVPQSLGDSIHESLERLRGAAQSERHAQEFPQAERSDDGRLRNVAFRHGNLMISAHQVYFGEDFLPCELRCEVLDSRQWVGVVRRDAVEPAVIAARAPTAAGFRCDVKRRCPRAFGPADDAEVLHVDVFLSPDEKFLNFS